MNIQSVCLIVCTAMTWQWFPPGELESVAGRGRMCALYFKGEKNTFREEFVGKSSAARWEFRTKVEISGASDQFKISSQGYEEYLFDRIPCSTVR